MANTINSSRLLTNYQNFLQADKNSSSKKSSSTTSNLQDAASKYGVDFSVDLSSKGLSSLNAKTAVDDSAGFVKDEPKLSSKAQDYLEKLRDKYGDYDFIISDDMSNPLELTKNSTKGHSVIFSSEEIEKMADDENFADKMMKQVDSAVKLTNEIDETTKLDDDLSFNKIGVQFDADGGNQKLFASIEKMSVDQRERLEAAKEKRAEELKNAENQKTDETAEVDEEDEEPYTLKQALVEANSKEELLKNIFNINWDEIEEEIFA